MFSSELDLLWRAFPPPAFYQAGVLYCQCRCCFKSPKGVFSVYACQWLCAATGISFSNNKVNEFFKGLTFHILFQQSVIGESQISKQTVKPHMCSWSLLAVHRPGQKPFDFTSCWGGERGAQAHANKQTSLGCQPLCSILKRFSFLSFFFKAELV